MKKVKLVSGGIDSYIMSQEIDGINVYVDFGQKYAKEEMEALNKLGVDFDVITISKENCSFGDVFISNRNLLLACLVEMYYEADEIYMAGLKDDNCIDKTESEFFAMSEIISRYAGKRVRVLSPYWQKTKGDIIQGFAHKEKLRDTFSCYTPINGKACGNCPACLRKVIALETNGIKSGINLSDNIIQEYMSKIHTYDSDRISRFFLFLKKYKPIIALDIDGVLCENADGFFYPNRKKIAFDTSRVKGSFVVLYTSRLECDRQVTEEWLAKSGIEYDALIMNKLPYDLLIDDKAEGV